MPTAYFYPLTFLALTALLSACGAAFQVGTEIQAGRYALMIARPDAALNHFRRAAELNGEYILDFSPFQQGVWTYVGRAYYDSGKLSEARKALERARSINDYDYLARLYLGLVLSRDEDPKRGVNELASGMKGIYDWLEYITYNTYYGQFWDPNREIRSEIRRTLAVATGPELELKTLIANGEWVGKKMEEEIDLARRDEANERMRQGEGRNGRRR